jgi:hypothetical protein
MATIASVLGEHAVRWEDVRLAEGGLLTYIFKHNGGRGFATWHTVHLPTEGNHTRANMSLLVHELTHVYQYETIGTRYMTEAIQIQAKMGQACYRYGGVAGLEEACRVKKPFATYNREAQAQIAQEYYVLKNAGNPVTMYEPYIAELQAGKF